MYAGIMIAIAAVINLNCANPIAGAFLFSIGLLTILQNECWLYTGMTDCWITELENSAKEPLPDALANAVFVLLQLVVVLFLNVCGAFIIGWLSTPFIADKAQAIVAAKAALPWYQLVWSGFMCGILMLIAVKTYKRSKKAIYGTITVILCVMGFILAGFDHSIADAAYVFISGHGGRAGIKIILCTALGNFLGGIIAHGVLFSDKRHGLL